MSRMSGPAGSSAAPFMLRRKQSFTRYSIGSTTPLRARYCGYRANTPIHEPVSRRPSSRWQLVQRSLLPTWFGKLSRVAVSSARPRRTASPYGPAGMTESAAAAVREGAAFEQAARLVMPRKTAKVLGRTRRDIPAFAQAATFCAVRLSKRAYPPPRIAMIAPLLTSLLLVVQNRPALDSATVTRLLNQLKISDSAVCALAGEALANYGGFWGHAFSDPGMPMPQPMPTPMPMPGGGPGEVHVDMHENTRDMDPAVLRAFRAVIRDDNRCVCSIAARVLGNHGGSESYSLFVGMLKDARADFRETGALGLGELHDSRAITPLSDALSGDASPVVRMTAAWALGEIEEKTAIDALTRALGDRAPEVRRTAAWALGELDDKRAVRPLSGALNDGVLEVRLVAVWALGEIEDASAVPLLATATKDRDSRVRQQAAWALGEIEDAQGIASLKTLMRDPVADVRKTAIWALGEIEDGGAVSALAAALKDSDPEVRVLTAWALGEIEDDRAVEPLVGALKDSDEDVRATAAWALGEIESPRARDGLTTAQRDEVGSVRHAATWALRQIDGNDEHIHVRVRPRVKVKP